MDQVTTSRRGDFNASSILGVGVANFIPQTSPPPLECFAIPQHLSCRIGINVHECVSSEFNSQSQVFDSTHHYMLRLGICTLLHKVSTRS